MSAILQSLDELQDLDGYKTSLKLQLKALAGGDPVYVSKDKVDFTFNGRPWQGYAVLLGGKGTLAVQKLRREGVLFREGTCQLEGRTLTLEGLPDNSVRGASRTLVKLQLGYKVRVAGEEGEGEAQEAGAEVPEAAEEAQSPAAEAPAEPREAEWSRIKAELTARVRSAGGVVDPRAIAVHLRQGIERERARDFEGAIAAFEELRGLLDRPRTAGASAPGESATGNGAPASELARKAGRIEKAVKVWRLTEQLASRELRKLQNAILDLGDPDGQPVIQGLETILTRLESLDDEAREAAEAAAREDQAGFDSARADFTQKMERILSYVQNDELIRDADDNPAVEIKLAETITSSLERLKAAI